MTAWFFSIIQATIRSLRYGRARGVPAERLPSQDFDGTRMLYSVLDSRFRNFAKHDTLSLFRIQFQYRQCHDMASPSRSSMDASHTVSVSWLLFQFCHYFLLSFGTSYKGVKLCSISIPPACLRRSRMCPLTVILYSHRLRIFVCFGFRRRLYYNYYAW